MVKDDAQQIKINREMREQFIDICRKIGIKEASAIQKFIVRSIAMNGFDIDLTSYDKIAAIKTDSRINFRIDKEKKTKFKELCEENGISVSGAIKLFMDDVIKANNMNKYFS
ncbi:plasmid partition protein ParG [Butyrivibrio sp. M55]|uniref:plasmid partition protein ParG n=1 Tax=Butyrivibrio sp. M55 TaxID=1855323 RepID=UPI0008E7B674|nr:plasmid partition protein ParG [Butyrivibrio sp. M55]SFU96032.1 addiction module antitoxin, RelB/DinJ family [Butyrivibrio sp. M55]